MNDREPFIYIKQMYMKGFFDLEENCKEKIISEDYWDFIIPLYRDCLLYTSDAADEL